MTTESPLLAEQLAEEHGALRARLDCDPAWAAAHGWTRRTNRDGSLSAYVHGGVAGIHPAAHIGADVVISHGSYENTAPRPTITIGPDVFIGGNSRIGANTHIHDGARLLDGHIGGSLTTEKTIVPAVLHGGLVVDATFLRSRATRPRIGNQARVDQSTLEEGVEVTGPGTEAAFCELGAYSALRAGVKAHLVKVTPGWIVDRPGKIKGVTIDSLLYSTMQAEEEMNRRPPELRETIFLLRYPLQPEERGFLKSCGILWDGDFRRAEAVPQMPPSFLCAAARPRFHFPESRTA